MEEYHIIKPWWVKEVNSLDVFQKLEIYLHYYCTMLKLKYDFQIVDKSKPSGQYGHGKEDISCGDISIYFLWKELKVLNFDDFISDKNFSVLDMDEKWEKNGCAQRFRTECTGIYEWYFKNSIIFRKYKN